MTMMIEKEVLNALHNKPSIDWYHIQAGFDLPMGGIFWNRIT